MDERELDAEELAEAETAGVDVRVVMREKASQLPPEAEPVMPASTLVAIAEDNSGLLEMPSTASRMTRNAGSEAITAP